MHKYSKNQWLEEEISYSCERQSKTGNDSVKIGHHTLVLALPQVSCVRAKGAKDEWRMLTDHLTNTNELWERLTLAMKLLPHSHHPNV